MLRLRSNGIEGHPSLCLPHWQMRGHIILGPSSVDPLPLAFHLPRLERSGLMLVTLLLVWLNVQDLGSVLPPLTPPWRAPLVRSRHLLLYLSMHHNISPPLRGGLPSSPHLSATLTRSQRCWQ